MQTIQKQEAIFKTISLREYTGNGSFLFYGGAGITQPLGKMSDGYKEAADMLAERKDLPDYFVYPICFLYRHALELKLKAIYFYYSLPINAPFTDEIVSRRNDFLRKNHHDLNKLWQDNLLYLRDKIKQFNVPEQLIQEISNGISQVDEFDHSSFEMRYPCSKEKDATYSVKINTTHEQIHGLDIVSLRAGIGILWSNLNLFSSTMDNLFEQFIGTAK